MAGETGSQPPRMRLADPLDFIQEATRQALAIDDATIERLVKVMQPAQRIFTYGRGRSGNVAKAFAVRLMHLGYSTYVIGETITAPVQKDDVVICISGSGTTYPVVMTAELGRRQGARVVAVTANEESEVARLAHVVIPIKTPQGNGTRERFAPLGTIFETAAWLLCDAVVALLKDRLGETEGKMRERHATLE